MAHMASGLPIPASASKQVTQPYIEIDVPELTLDFGAVHLSMVHEVEIGLTNPTEAEACWSIKHAPVKLTAREIARQRS